MPRDRLRSEHLNVDPGAVTSFHDKPREHSDAGAGRLGIDDNGVGGSYVPIIRLRSG
jgi:hypothetical protein